MTAVKAMRWQHCSKYSIRRSEYDEIEYKQVLLFYCIVDKR